MTNPNEPKHKRPERMTLGGGHKEAEVQWITHRIGTVALHHPQLVGEVIPALVTYNPDMGVQVIVATNEMETFLCNAISTLALELASLRDFAENTHQQVLG
jgi:hypothetical protein